MNKILLYIALLLTSLGLYSCEEEIDMKYKTSEPQLVVDAVFTDVDQEHYVILSKSAEFDSGEPNPYISDATVTLSDGENEITLSEMEETPGTYVIPQAYHAIYGKTYTLSISGVDINLDGEEELYEASNTLKPVAPVDSVGLTWTTAYGQKEWQVLLYSKDPEETRDFYAFSVSVNNELITPNISELEFADDKYFNGNDVVGVWVQSIIEEDEDGEVTKYPLKEGDWVKLEMQGLNEDYYNFILAVDIETGIKVPLFSGPPANVPTNISNGGIGFFRVYSVSQDSIQVTTEILNQRDS